MSACVYVQCHMVGKQIQLGLMIFVVLLDLHLSNLHSAVNTVHQSEPTTKHRLFKTLQSYIVLTCINILTLSYYKALSGWD